MHYLYRRRSLGQWLVDTALTDAAPALLPLAVLLDREDRKAGQS